MEKRNGNMCLRFSFRMEMDDICTKAGISTSGRYFRMSFHASSPRAWYRECGALKRALESISYPASSASQRPAY